MAPVLSICISTYNNCENISKHIKEWLKSSNQNFEIIVSVNGSPDNTWEVLSQINDERFKLYKNEENLGTLNGLYCFKYAAGKYILAITDKDSLITDYLDEITDILEKTDFSVAKFELNFNSKKFKVKKIGKNKILRKFCFCTNHPSGFVYNREIFFKNDITNRVLNFDPVIRSFLTDYMSALMAQYGPVYYFRIPFVTLCSLRNSRPKKSLTYSQKNNNLYFEPKNRFLVYDVTLKFLENIKITPLERLFFIKQKAKDLYFYITDFYKLVLENKLLCEYYGISEEFAKSELSKNYKPVLFQNILKSNKFNSKVEKLFALLGLCQAFLTSIYKPKIKFKEFNNNLILLTGATGFFGSHLLRSLIKNGYKVVIIKRTFSNTARIKDLLKNKNLITFNSDKKDIEEVFKKYKFNTVIHCATKYDRNTYSCSDVLEANLIFPVKLLDLCVKYKVPSFINTDSYSNKKNVSHPNLFDYTESKRALVLWLKRFSKKLKIVNMVLEHIYGEYDNKDKFVYQMIKKIAIDRVESLDLTQGIQKRDFIYVDDVCQAYLKALEYVQTNDFEFKSFDVGTGVSIPLREFVEEIKKVSNSPTKLNFGALPTREGEIMISCANAEELKSIGFKPQYSTSEAIAKIIKKGN